MDSIHSKVCDLFGIRYPIIQGGMIWCSGWELASAISNSGGLGIIGSVSMKPEILEMHIRKTRNATNHPFAVNVPLIYPYAKEMIEISIREQVKIVFTSAGNPKTWTSYLREKGMFEGDLVEGELEIGQVSSMIKEILPVKEIIRSIVQEFDLAKAQIIRNSN